MFGSALVALFAAVLSIPGQGAPIDPGMVLAVSTPTYGTDGTVTGASTNFDRLVINQPLVFYPHGGKTLCDSASATPSMPSDAGNGWRVQVVPLRHSGSALVLQVDWERMWVHGTRVNAPRGKAQV